MTNFDHRQAMRRKPGRIEGRRRKRDMYGHPVRPLGRTGYGVSVSFYRKCDGPLAPAFTVFHKSDGFRQALFTVTVDRGQTPTVLNMFRDRMDEVEAHTNDRR